jgi:hypothetical protein
MDRQEMAEPSPTLRDLVTPRAAGRFEYCRILQARDRLKFHLEHVMPRQHGGQSTVANLALACSRCNWHRGTNLSAIDPDSGLVSMICNPRTDAWEEHFHLKPDGTVSGRTATGRSIVRLLRMNNPSRVILRSELPA